MIFFPINSRNQKELKKFINDAVKRGDIDETKQDVLLQLFNLENPCFIIDIYSAQFTAN